MVRKRSKRRRRKSRKMPLSAGAGLIVTATARPYNSWSSPIEAIQNGQMDLALQSGLANLTGITIPIGGHTGQPIFDIKSLNPFDFSLGAGWKSALWTSIALRVANAISGGKGNRMLEAIPFIGKKVSFS